MNNEHFSCAFAVHFTDGLDSKVGLLKVVWTEHFRHQCFRYTQKQLFGTHLSSSSILVWVQKRAKTTSSSSAHLQFQSKQDWTVNRLLVYDRDMSSNKTLKLNNLMLRNGAILSRMTILSNCGNAQQLSQCSAILAILSKIYNDYVV